VGTFEHKIRLTSDHPNPGHYTVAADFVVQAAIKAGTLYVCAPSADLALEAASGLCDPKPLASSMSVEINWPKDGAIVSPAGTGGINIKASILDGTDPFVDQYDVEATVEYLDDQGEVFDTEGPFLLFNDGLLVHQDDKKGDNFYNQSWYPRFAGQARITVHAVGVGPNLEDEDSIVVEVTSVQDIGVTSVYADTLPRKEETARILAEITNFGDVVDDPILVKFEYFDIHRLTTEATGPSLKTSDCVLFRDSGQLVGGESILVLDTSYTPEEVKGFRARVTVTLDPQIDISGMDLCQTP
jgi:hypothetical protein